MSGIHDCGEVNAGATVEESPDETRSEGQGRFEHEDEGYPLVVVDVLSLILYCQHVLLHCVCRGQVERVAYLLNELYD